MSQNPYASPTTSDGDGPTLLIWGLGFVMASAVVGALLGTALGVSLAALVPSYYRSVFSSGDAPDFDPLAVGIGLGATQGAGGGAAIGVVILALYLWYRSRVRSHQP